MPALMERRQNRFRVDLLIRCQQRKPLHQWLDLAAKWLEKNGNRYALRWHISVDPSEIF